MNTELQSQTPVVHTTVGLPHNLDPEAVLKRKVALINAGTEPLLAEKFAIDAEQQQHLRDKHLKAVATLKEVPATTEVIEVTTEPDGSKKKGGK